MNDYVIEKESGVWVLYVNGERHGEFVTIKEVCDKILKTEAEATPGATP